MKRGRWRHAEEGEEDLKFYVMMEMDESSLYLF
jgi:hypothetical protein